MTGEALQRATSGWIIHTVALIGIDPTTRASQFWIATYADRSDALRAVEMAPGLMPNAYLEIRGVASRQVIEQYQLGPNIIMLYAPDDA
jgi:hypothetical protein